VGDIGGVMLHNSRGTQGLHRVLIYGKGGSGKTTFLSTVPGIVIGNSDGKDVRSISHLDVPVFEINSRLDALKFIRMASSGELQKEVNKIKEFKDYEVKAIALDSMTGMASYHVQDTMGGKEMPSRQDWPKITSRQRTIITLANQLPLDVFYTARVYYEKDSETETVIAFPAVIGQLRSDFEGLVHECYYMEASPIENSTAISRKLYTVPTKYYTAKTETKDSKGHPLPARLEPDWGKIVNLLEVS